MIAKFFAKSAHMGIDRSCIRSSGISPHIAQEGFAGENSPPVVDECEEELELDGGQIQSLIAHRSTESGFVD